MCENYRSLDAGCVMCVHVFLFAADLTFTAATAAADMFVVVVFIVICSGVALVKCSNAISYGLIAIKQHNQMYQMYL